MRATHPQPLVRRLGRGPGDPGSERRLPDQGVNRADSCPESVLNGFRGIFLHTGDTQSQSVDAVAVTLEEPLGAIRLGPAQRFHQIGVYVTHARPPTRPDPIPPAPAGFARAGRGSHSIEAARRTMPALIQPLICITAPLLRRRDLAAWLRSPAWPTRHGHSAS